MFGSTILDIAIGLIFIYLLLSLVCSGINEWIAGVLALRARNLANGIKNLLHDNTGTALAKEIYNHSLIQELSRSGQRLTSGGKLDGKHGPSYIRARTFAVALMDHLNLLVPSNPQAASDERIKEQLGVLDKANLNDKVKEGITALVKQANGDVATLQQNFENWFDDAMDRVSGWYKKQTQYSLFLFGVVIAVLMNADTIYIARTLLHNDSLRASIVMEAGKVSEKPQPPNTVAIIDELKRIPLPIGWTNGSSWVSNVHDEGIFLAFVGWLFTAAALSLGAPFWFDILNKVMNIRMAGPTPADKVQSPTPKKG